MNSEKESQEKLVNDLKVAEKNRFVTVSQDKSTDKMIRGRRQIRLGAWAKVHSIEFISAIAKIWFCST